jgi:citronellol/citronellal dehydrogenase
MYIVFLIIKKKNEFFKNMTKNLAVEWSIYNIKINSVAPGVIISSGINKYGKETLERAKEETPLKRCGTCEVSHLVTFLASEKASSYITGQTYYIDGGASLWGDTFK